jgi:hypothetical protein
MKADKIWEMFIVQIILEEIFEKGVISCLKNKHIT